MSDRHNRTKTASVGKTASAGTIKYFDYSLLFIIIFLVGFGLVMLLAKQRFGYMTHHQLCPSPDPITTRKASYTPPGKV